eukprot:4934682-Pyramimonas_sp.AAC.1
MPVSLRTQEGAWEGAWVAGAHVALVLEAAAEEARSPLPLVGALVRHVPAPPAVEAAHRRRFKVLVEIPRRP